MKKTVISWTQYILDICFVLSFQVLTMPSKYKQFQNLGPFYTPVSRRAVLCDWVWRAGGGVYTGFRTITLVLYIGSLPNPIYFGVIRSKVKVSVTINRIFDNRVVSAR